MTVFSEENIVNGINALTINEHTKNKYMKYIRIGMWLKECDSLGYCLKIFKKIKKALEESPRIQNPELKYGISSKKGLVQSILFVIDTFKKSNGNNCSHAHPSR